VRLSRPPGRNRLEKKLPCVELGRSLRQIEHLDAHNFVVRVVIHDDARGYLFGVNNIGFVKREIKCIGPASDPLTY
jgi:hypothetical protein